MLTNFIPRRDMTEKIRSNSHNDLKENRIDDGGSWLICCAVGNFETPLKGLNMDPPVLVSHCLEPPQPHGRRKNTLTIFIFTSDLFLDIGRFNACSIFTYATSEFHSNMWNALCKTGIGTVSSLVELGFRYKWTIIRIQEEYLLSHLYLEGETANTLMRTTEASAHHLNLLLPASKGYR